MKKVNDLETRKNKYTNYLLSRDIEMIGVFVNARTKTKHLCLVCGEKWSPVPGSVKSGSGCNICSRKRGSQKKSISPLQFFTKIKDYNLELVNNDYYDESRITDTKLFRCKKCGYEKPVTCAKIYYNNSKCVKCLGQVPPTTEEYKEQIKDTVYVCIEEYNGGHTKINHQCKNCSTIVMKEPVCVKGGNGCRNCADTKSNYLKYKNKPTTLYLIDVKNHGIKPGLAQKPMTRRFSSEQVEFTIIEEIYYTDGWEAYKHEQFILQETKNDQIYYRNKDGPLRGGNTEIRSIQSASVILSYYSELKNNKNKEINERK